MNAKEFLNKVFKMFPFPKSYSETQQQDIYDQYYYGIMKEGNFNFEKAFEELMNTYTKQTYPSYAEIKNILIKYRVIQRSDNGMTCPVQIINFKVMRNGVKRDYAFSTADSTYEVLKRQWERKGYYVITDKYGEDIPINDYHYAKET